MNARAADLAPPLLFGLAVLAVWEVGVRAARRAGDHPAGALGDPAAARHLAPTLAADFLQTIRGVLAGYAIGCGAGLVVAILIDRSPFLQRGLLPLGNLVSALPIVGVAPIMVMWFGFDWQSKAAVVVVMTFFPMLVNATAGLAGAGRDGARPDEDLRGGLFADAAQAASARRRAVRLQRAEDQYDAGDDRRDRRRVLRHADGRHGLSHLTEVGHLSIDMVWATIVVAAVTGSAFYALVALIERRVTFWHASYRSARIERFRSRRRPASPAARRQEWR